MIHTGLQSALRLLLAGADSCGEPKAFAVTARRQISGKSFRPVCLCGTSFAQFARLGASTQAVRNVSHSFALRKFRIPHDTLAMAQEAPVPIADTHVIPPPHF